MLHTGGKSSKLEKQIKICRLARQMGNAIADSEAFRLAADVCCDIFPRVCSISVALMSKDGVNLNYFKLNNSNNGSHLHMGTLPAAGSASGLAMELKLPVYTSSFEHGGLNFEDWRHVHLRDGAASMISAPLIISDKALGSLNLASSNQHAFDGCEDLAKTLAAILAPYLGLQKFRKELKAVEGVLHQMVPMRVALRLTELQSRVFALAQHGGSSSASVPYGISNSSPADEVDSGDEDCHELLAARLCGSQWGSPTASRRKPHGSAHTTGVTFADPHLEQQFICAMCHSWQLYIDVGFFCLTLASLFGMAMGSVFQLRWSRGLTGALTLVMPFVAVPLALIVRNLPSYLKYREGVLAAARLLRSAVFVVHSLGNPVAPASQLSIVDVSVSSGAMILVVQALAGQVRLCWHAPVHWVSTTMLVIGTILGNDSNTQYIFQAICQQMFIGFCLPTILLALLENRLRHRFLGKSM